MNKSLTFVRFFFTFLCMFFITGYIVFYFGAISLSTVSYGIVIGLALSALFFSIDNLLQKFNLRAFNLTLFGLFPGYLMGFGLNIIFRTCVSFLPEHIIANTPMLQITQVCLMLLGIYIGTIMTIRSADEIHLSIPFVKFTSQTRRKKDLLLDLSALCDPRIIDLASSGIVDHHLIIPRFLLKELYLKAEKCTEQNKIKAAKCAEALKKLEEMQELEMRYTDTNFPEIKDPTDKLQRLARLIDANILTSDITKVEMANIEGIRIINLNLLSNALKPLMETGEQIRIKIQRCGKEPRQGVGYLDDGTMVVVNGGGDFIGETIDSHVLSVKHTSSGRMIFCNTMEEPVSAIDLEKTPVT